MHDHWIIRPHAPVLLREDKCCSSGVYALTSCCFRPSWYLEELDDDDILYFFQPGDRTDKATHTRIFGKATPLSALMPRNALHLDKV